MAEPVDGVPCAAEICARRACTCACKFDTVSAFAVTANENDTTDAIARATTTATFLVAVVLIVYR
jgi:hypothetical protein